MLSSWVRRWAGCCAGPGTQHSQSSESHASSVAPDAGGHARGRECAAEHSEVGASEEEASGHVSSGHAAASSEGEGPASESSEGDILAEGQDHTHLLDGFPELWTEILQHVPELDRLRNVPLVSRRFNEACHDPSLWTELHVDAEDFWTEARWRSFLRWLAAQSSGLRAFLFTDEIGDMDPAEAAAWENRTPELMRVLAAEAPQLKFLILQYPYGAPANPTSALPAEIGQLSQLTSLCLRFGKAPVTAAQVDAMVQTMPLLQHLDIDGSMEPSGGFPVSIATSCSQLRSLAILDWKVGAVPPELGGLTALTQLRLTDCGVTSLPDSISRLTALRELHVFEDPNLDKDVPPELALPPGLTACRQLTQLEMDSDSASPVLARLQSLRRLTVRSLPDQQPQTTYWTQLTALTELMVYCRESNSVPAGLGGMTGLRTLHIAFAVLDLPPGPYLRNLRDLRLLLCTFQAGVPASLAAASQLRQLDLSYNSGLRLSAADVALISSLPALSALELGLPPEEILFLRAEGLAELEAVCAAKCCALTVSF